jgi:hypothetical protein
MKETCKRRADGVRVLTGSRAVRANVKPASDIGGVETPVRG